MTNLAVRRVATLSTEELVESAARRLRPMIDAYGAGSPRVAEVIGRWSTMVDARANDRDLLALVTATAPR